MVSRGSGDERTGLLSQDVGTDRSQSISSSGSTRTAIAVLPVALLAVLAMAATAATTIYAYAYLLCEDPKHCKDSERTSYTKTVAVATTAANLCSLFVVGPFARLFKNDPKHTLVIWLGCRSMSVVCLIIGVTLRNIDVAACGMVFEGLASDNILHFSLNAIYVQIPDSRLFPRFIGTSLALYMIGICVSPTAAGLLASFRARFVMAAALFAAALLYLLLALPKNYRNRSAPIATGSQQEIELRRGKLLSMRIVEKLGDVCAPLALANAVPISLYPATALFCYNSIQSYTFTALMVHTSLEFEFASRENGFLLSIAHAVAAAYLLATTSLRAAWNSRVPRTENSSQKQGTADVPLAMISLVVQAYSLLLFGLAVEKWQVYAIIGLIALGLSTPSFIKSYFVTLFPHPQRSKALGILTIMEALGGLISPIALGGLQTALPGNMVFFVASGSVFGTSILFLIGIVRLKSTLAR